MEAAFSVVNAPALAANISVAKTPILPANKEESKKGFALSNNRAMAIFWEAVDEHSAENAQRTKEITEAILSKAPWYKSDDEVVYRCEFRKWGLITVQALATAASLSYFASQFWRGYDSVVYNYCWNTNLNNISDPNNDCTFYYKYNLSTCYQTPYSGYYYGCPSGTYTLSAGGFFTDLGLTLFGLAGTAGVPSLLTWVGTSCTAKLTSWFRNTVNDSAIKKIEDCRTSLTPYGESDFSITPQIAIRLYDLGLNKSTREKILHEMNATQNIMLKKYMGERKFVSFSKDVLLPHQKLYLRFFQALPNLDMVKIKKEIKQLTPFIKKDLSLWKEIIHAVEVVQTDEKSVLYKNKDGQQVSVYLLKLGKDIAFLPSNATLEDIRTHITINISLNDEVQLTRSINLENLLEYPYFKELIRGNFQGSVKGASKNFELDLSFDSEEELAVYSHLFNFIENKELTLNDKIVPLIIKLADSYEITECIEICYEYLIKHQDRFELFQFLELICNYANFTGSKDKHAILVHKKFQQAINTSNLESINSFLLFVKKHELKLDLTKEVQDFLALHISIHSKNINFLRACEEGNLELLYPLVEERYLKILSENLHIFSLMWDFANKASKINKDKIRPAILTAYCQLTGDNAAFVDNQWPPGKNPIEFMEMV